MVYDTRGEIGYAEGVEEWHDMKMSLGLMHNI